MKRKFSFNLPPVKVPGRSDSYTKQTPEPTPSHGSSHRRHHSKGSVSSLDSPYISRRPIDTKTEQELRAACALILQNFKPSDYDFVDADPKLDFSGPHKRREHKTEPAQVRVHKPTGAPAEPKTTHDARRQSHKTSTAEKGYPDLPAQANTGRRRIDFCADKEIDTRKNPKSPTNEPPKSATIRPEIDSDDAKSLGTPLTASTDAHLHNGSTAPTSVAMTSGRSSKRTSRQFESAAAVADAEAAEWMRQELEKRRQQLASQPQHEQHSSHRPPSRASSIKAGIKEYIFPGSTNLSRSQSRESLRTMNSNTSGQPKRSGSSHGWRSWGLQRKSSSRASSRPSTSNGRVERPEQDKKPDLNLNRELPPLPSLDTWKEPEKKKEQRKSQIQGAHIATVMRTQDQQDQQRKDYAAAIRKHHRRSGSDTLAMKYANAFPKPAANVKSSTQQATMPNHAAPALDISMDFDQMMSTMSSHRNLDDQLKLRVNGHVPQRSASTISHSPDMKGRKSTDGRLAAPNFSRKISTDVAPSQRNNDQHFAYPNVVQISGPAQKDEQKSKLRRVLSGWMLKKEKKDDWMQKFEKEGIKGGVMIQDESALPPVVRY